MKFITISVAALSLGSNVLAAPTSLINSVSSFPAVAPAVAKVESLTSSAESGLHKKDVVSTVESVPVVGAVTGKVAGVTGSVPHKKGVPVITTITGSVSILKTSVQSEVTTLSSYSPTLLL